MNPPVTNVRMAEIAQALAATLAEHADGELVPGPFSGSDLQLCVKLSNGQMCSVLPDADLPALYEVVHFADAGDQMCDKLTLQGVLEQVHRLARR